MILNLKRCGSYLAPSLSNSNYWTPLLQKGRLPSRPPKSTNLFPMPEGEASVHGDIQRRPQTCLDVSETSTNCEWRSGGVRGCLPPFRDVRRCPQMSDDV